MVVLGVPQGEGRLLGFCLNVSVCMQVHGTGYCTALRAGSSEEDARYKHVQVWIDGARQVQNQV